ncbi:hypothetical protein [Wenyingzhuangia sp. IMCC45467]
MKNKQYKPQGPSKKLIITVTTLWGLGQVLLIYFFKDLLKNNLLSFDYLLLDLLIISTAIFIYRLNYNYFKKTRSAYAHVRRY